MKTYIGKKLDSILASKSKVGTKTIYEKEFGKRTGAKTKREMFADGTTRDTYIDFEGKKRGVAVQLPTGERLEDRNNDGRVDYFSVGVKGKNLVTAADFDHDRRVDYLSREKSTPSGGRVSRDLHDTNRDGVFDLEATYKWDSQGKSQGKGVNRHRIDVKVSDVVDEDD